MRLTVIFPLLVIFATAPATAAMYKWTDADGHVQYGQHPPAGVNAKPIQATPPPTSTPARKSLDQQLEALDKQLEERKEQEAKAEQEKQDADIRKINCENAKKNIEQLNLGGHRLSRMPDGSYKRFTEEERQAEIAKNKQAVDEFCK